MLDLFFFNDTATTEIYTLSLHDALPISTQLDAVHRVLGRPGVILVGEGSPSRVRPLLAQEKKRLARIAGDAPIYDVLVGDDEGQVRSEEHTSELQSRQYLVCRLQL